MKHNIITSILSLFLAVIFFSCKNDNISTTNPTDLNTMSGENAIDILYSVESDSCGETNQNVINKPKPTNKAEEVADEKKIEKLEKDLSNSKYSSCSEILDDYVDILEQLKKGNTKPLKEFPLTTDPKIALCKNLDKKFAQTLDSLQQIGIKVIDEM